MYTRTRAPVYAHMHGLQAASYIRQTLLLGNPVCGPGFWVVNIPVGLVFGEYVYLVCQAPSLSHHVCAMEKSLGPEHIEVIPPCYIHIFDSDVYMAITIDSPPHTKENNCTTAKHTKQHGMVNIHILLAILL